MTARTLMIQGTASSVGKSLLVTALCRIFRQDGWRVAPFKSQNMALNSFVTRDGGEMGRAQVVQALAARVEPVVEMNPVLLKPEADHRSQVVVMGRARGSMGFRDYRSLRPELLGVIETALDRLRAAHDLVIIEGAGSPAEINLKAGEIVNMRIARMAEAPVVLAGDIDRGGVFAHLVGTLELLDPDERARIRAFFINKFRGDASLLQPGLDFLEARTGIPVIGVVPYVPDLRLPEEDSVALEGLVNRVTSQSGATDGVTAAAGHDQSAVVDIAVIALPHVANFDDFDPLAREPGVAVRYVDSTERLGRPDLVVLPGTKTTLADLRWLRARGLAGAIQALAAGGAPVIGICGGYQMLGRWIEDPHGAESAPGDALPGLGLLPVDTIFEPVKATHQVTARIATAHGLLAEGAAAPIYGYEIHMGRTRLAGAAGSGQWVPAGAADTGAKDTTVGRLVPSPAFVVVERSARHPGGTDEVIDGALDASGRIMGTYLHGLFDNGHVRRSVLRYVARLNGRSAQAESQPWGSDSSLDAELDRLAGIVRANLDVARLYKIIGLRR